MIFFTIIPSQKSGFTDQLMQFNILYIIGKTMGYHYAHTPFSSARSSGISPIFYASEAPSDSSAVNDHSIPSGSISDENVFDFIGFNEHFIKSNPIETLENVFIKNVALSDELCLNNQIGSFDELLDYLRKAIEPEETDDHGNLLVQFSIEGKRRFTGIVLSDERAKQHTINLRQIYNQKRKLLPHPELFSTKINRILVHIRQGDISVIKTPWDTFIPVDRRMKGWMTEFSSFEELLPLRELNQLIGPGDFYQFLTTFLDRLKDSQYEMLIFSDGYERAFQMITEYSANFNFDEGQKTRLLAHAQSYDQVNFDCFKSIRNCRMVIGESVPQLFDLIHSVLSSDIVIVGLQQRMIVKLITQFCGEDKPVVIVLYRTEIPDLSNIHPNDSQRFIYTNLNDFNLEKLMARVDENLVIR